jgi:hypothetical protein
MRRIAGITVQYALTQSMGLCPSHRFCAANAAAGTQTSDKQGTHHGWSRLAAPGKKTKDRQIRKAATKGE